MKKRILFKFWLGVSSLALGVILLLIHVIMGETLNMILPGSSEISYVQLTYQAGTILTLAGIILVCLNGLLWISRSQ